MPKGDHRLTIDVGTLFGSLTVKSEAPKNGYKRHFVCECVCGEEITVPLTRLTHGKQKTCRKCFFEGLKVEVYPGQVFGQLTVIQEEPEIITENKELVRPKRIRRILKCKCSCGNEVTTPLHSVLNEKNPKCFACGRDAMRKFSTSEQNARRAILEYVKGAESRNIDFNLSFDDFCDIIVRPCHYCGDKDTNSKQQKGRGRSRPAPPFFYTGIDRVDSNQGYVKENCVPCCAKCNRMKLAEPQDVFLNQVKKIYEHTFLNSNRTKEKSYD